jgi:hypothetical protein
MSKFVPLVDGTYIRTSGWYEGTMGRVSNIFGTCVILYMGHRIGYVKVDLDSFSDYFVAVEKGDTDAR